MGGVEIELSKADPLDTWVILEKIFLHVWWPLELVKAQKERS